MRYHFGSNVVTLLVLLALTLGHSPVIAEQHQEYSFLVAGHVYGAHGGKNVGVYPKFLKVLPESVKESDRFLVLTGDIVRRSKETSWLQVEDELSQSGLPIYYVMGNHDLSKFAKGLFREKFNGTFYDFKYGTDLFIVLDSQLDRGSITGNQLEFLKKKLDQNPETKNVFIFFHELIWTARNPKYKEVKHNYGSYDKLYSSNYWDEVHPLLIQHGEKDFFIMTGDVSGNSKAIPAFYEKLDNVFLIASGMGEIQNENFLRITVKDRDVSFDLIPLNHDNTLLPLEEYGLE